MSQLPEEGGSVMESPVEAEANGPILDQCAAFVFPVFSVEAECCRPLYKLSDLMLMAEVQAFVCHRLVLAAASPFFGSIFTNGMK